ncbi:lasso peptide biosynthesis B2 protein [Niveispirillum sp. KHB5.9]|uniref:lasso peptide biosynthesis B2 protein n=1 Tax=Niveispirillum sp. KHB5.9 TaxID=3400269 RepID=UPI003A87EBDD
MAWRPAPRDPRAPDGTNNLDRARAVALRIGRVAARLLLARRGIRGSGIRFGVRKQGGALEAHAWLVLDDTILLGGEEAADYVPLADMTRAKD